MVSDTTLPATRRATRKSISAMERDNATVDLGAGTTLADNRKKSKSRSKSMGPGGLDALKAGSGNRRVSLAGPARPLPRSILKPTMPLAEIPGYKPRHSYAPGAGDAENHPSLLNGDDLGSSRTKVALRTEEEQQATARERDREERERAALEKEIKDRREARRKSLANRRVSFAAEATLHTFHEVEYMQDSTASTDCTRRGSSTAVPREGGPQANDFDPDASDTTSTPRGQVEDMVAGSPGDQQHLHQRDERVHSSLPPENEFDTQSHDTIASTVYDSDSDEGDDVAEVQTEASGSESDSDSDGTMMTMDAEEMTSASLASTRYGDEADNTTSSLDGALREAARRAVNQPREQDEDEDEEVISGFKGWGRKAREQREAAMLAEDSPSEQEIPSSPLKSSPLKSSPEKSGGDGGTEREREREMDMDLDMDMDMTNAMGGIIQQTIPSSPDQAGQEDMSMDVTNVYGGIFQQLQFSTQDHGSAQDEQTMEFTTAVGGIQQPSLSDDDQDIPSDEEMSMELTTVMGRVLGANNKQLRQSLHLSSSPVKDPADVVDNGDGSVEATLNETKGISRILSTNNERVGLDADAEDGTATGMELIAAVGVIGKPVSPAERSAAKKLMEQEADQPETATTPDLNAIRSQPKQPSVLTVAGDSPSLSALSGNKQRRSNGLLFPAAPKSPPRSASPASQRKTRSQGPASPASPASSRSPARVSSHTPTPKSPGPPSRNLASYAKSTPLSKSPARPSSSLFQRDATTGSRTPLVVLTPQIPKLSGVGVDRSGIGSPRVTELLGRRSSIGDTATTFSPIQLPQHGKVVAFDDPRVMEEEIDRERRDEQDRESGRRVPEREVDDVTSSLKEMIQGLSPKKNQTRGRKSLHIGSAKGLLGKRPSELEDDSDAEVQDGIKRLKGHQESPVKNIKLQQPPSKAETTGSRPTFPPDRAPGDLEDETFTPTAAPSESRATTPRQQGRFKDVENDLPTNTFTFHATPLADPADLRQPDEDEDRIHLQDFLNLTSIRFMELTTTKRRHTILPSARKSSISGDKDSLSLEQCVVAGACTVPMLELFQHCCRELKKYISEGRKIVREIETETFQENPPLFREYITASPEFKNLMDNQFKNVKTNARLLSKAMWYDWRMKLQDGLREGLVKIAEGMMADEQLLERQQKLLASVLPAMAKQLDTLTREYENLDAVASELEDCDPRELESARADLASVEDDMELKNEEIAQLREQFTASEQMVDQLVDQKQRYNADIKEAERAREECRGWSSAEISGLKARVDAIEKRHGWAITGVVGTSVSVSYRREIELVFNTTSFKPGQPNSRIDVCYIAANRHRNPVPLTPDKEFCLECVRDHLRCLPQSKTKVSTMLGVVGRAWDRATALGHQIYQLNLAFPTSAARSSDSSISITSALLLAPLQTKVDVNLIVQGSVGVDSLEFLVSVQAVVVYGEHFNAGKMADFLSRRIGQCVYCPREKESETWANVVSDFHTRLLARGKK
ncbi:Spc7 kinetochore protein [Diaporthe helianthi]|uniref:Spc7 kinetochore protein n=1 Tax=Diaporthe helianthi TaxID=158607 RepID=A0A2P5I4Y1_DIAHE|nr:Spc7 kinetochore protein [Diaporthe helianthi]